MVVMSFLLWIRARILSAAKRLTWLPPTLVRVSLGLLFLETGWGKLHDINKVVNYFGELGIPGPEFTARLVATTEFSCGSLLLLGLATRLAALPLLISMSVAIMTAKREQMESFTDLVMFPEYLFVLLLLWISISGPGPIALDRIVAYFADKPQSRVPTDDQSQNKLKRVG